MKKILTIFLPILVSICFVGCRAATTTLAPDPETLVFAFVPANPDDATMQANVIILETMIEQRLTLTGYRIDVSFTLLADEMTIVDGMESSHVHVGFLNAESYAYATLAHPAAIDVMLASAFDANEAQLNDEFVVTDPAMILASVNSSGYLGLTQSDIRVGTTYSMLLVRAEDVELYRSEGVSWLAGKNVAVQSSTSRYGFVEPQFILSQNQLSFIPNVEHPEAAAGEVGYSTITGHANAIIALMDGTVDACFTYLDAREDDADFILWQAMHPDLDRFAETKAVALSDGIFGTVVAVRKTLSADLRNAIRQALLAISYVPDGAAAMAFLTDRGYLVVHDEAFDGERALYRFRHPELDQ